MTSDSLTGAVEVIATLGPGALDDPPSSPRSLHQLCAAAPDWLRVNMSHTSPDDAEMVVASLAEHDHRPRLLWDLQGMKARVGSLQRSVRISPGDIVELVPEQGWPAISSRVTLVPVTTPFPFAELTKSTVVRLKDATVELRILENAAGDEERPRLFCRAQDGGILRAEKGLNFPGVVRAGHPLPAKDRRDIELAARLGPDAVCVSFAVSGAQIAEVRELMTSTFTRPVTELWAKVECGEGIERLAEIVDACDAVLVGRGDLAGELGIDAVERATEAIVGATVAAGRRCYVGTGVLSTLVRSAAPSQSEIDSIEALLALGVSGFLLTAETSIGKDPSHAIETVRTVARRREAESS